MNELSPATYSPDGYSTPQDVLADAALSSSAKQRLLEDWREDLLERLTATAENMPRGAAAAGDTAEQLRRVNLALQTLEKV